jgi:hypothetical protein
MPKPRNVVRALSSRNYRLYYGGQGISVVGTWITRVATSWLVYRLTGSPLMLGVTGFLSPASSLTGRTDTGSSWSRKRSR